MSIALASSFLKCISSISSTGGNNLNFTTAQANVTLFLETFQSRIRNPEFSNVPEPLAIVLPNSAQDVAALIACYTSDPKLPTASQLLIRGGGHSYEGNSYSGTEGLPILLIDLQNMSNITVDDIANTATVGGGVLLGDLYAAIDKVKPSYAPNNEVYAFPAGSCDTVGVGGHIQGGGYGFLGRAFGMAADNVVEMEVVTSDGKVRTVNANSTGLEGELYWGLRGGGGGNFGVVTQFTLGLVLVPPTVVEFSITVTGIQDQVTVFQEFQAWMATATTDLSFMDIYWSGKQQTINGFYLGTDGIKGITGLLKTNMPVLSSYAAGTFKSVAYAEHTISTDGPDGTAFKAKSSIATTPLSLSTIQTFQTIIQNGSPESFVLFDSYGGKMWSTPTNFNAFPWRNGSLFSIQYYVSYDDSSKQDSLTWIDGLYKTIVPLLENSGAAYVNYIDNDLGEWNNTNSNTSLTSDQTWSADYFSGNYARLEALKGTADPINLWRFEQSFGKGEMFIPLRAASGGATSSSSNVTTGSAVTTTSTLSPTAINHKSSASSLLLSNSIWIVHLFPIFFL